jgi:hypothetical protein
MLLAQQDSIRTALGGPKDPCTRLLRSLEGPTGRTISGKKTKDASATKFQLQTKSKTIKQPHARTCRFAGWPTRRSPLSVKATIDGVVREPSEFSSTCRGASGTPRRIKHPTQEEQAKETSFGETKLSAGRRDCLVGRVRDRILLSQMPEIHAAFSLFGAKHLLEHVRW